LSSQKLLHVSLPNDVEVEMAGDLDAFMPPASAIADESEEARALLFYEQKLARLKAQEDWHALLAEELLDRTPRRGSTAVASPGRGRR
jgi:hypothetical protein